MKSFIQIFSFLAIISAFGLTSCLDASHQPDSKGVSITVASPTLSLQVGESVPLRYTVTPAGTAVTFTSDHPTIATVTDQGIVQGVSEGAARISLQAGDATQVVVVTVTPGKAPIPEGNEVALIVKYNQDNELVKAHEAKIGRTLTNLPTMAGNIPIFHNGDLKAITAAAYGLTFAGGAQGILMLSREKAKNSPITRRMLEEVGFVNFVDETIENEWGDKFDGFSATYKYNPDVELVAVDNEAFIGSFPEATLRIQVTFPQQQISYHDPVNVQDFPSIQLLKAEDEAGIKKFESDLALRQFDPDDIGTGLSFHTLDSKLASTNFISVKYVFHPTSGSKFIQGPLNCVQTNKDLESEALKTWLTTNGVTDIQVSPGWLMGKNALGGVVQIFFSNNQYIFQSTTDPLNSSQMAQLRSEGIKLLQENMLHRQLQPIMVY